MLAMIFVLWRVPHRSMQLWSTNHQHECRVTPSDDLRRLYSFRAASDQVK